MHTHGAHGFIFIYPEISQSFLKKKKEPVVTSADYQGKWNHLETAAKEMAVPWKLIPSL